MKMTGLSEGNFPFKDKLGEKFEEVICRFI